MVEGFKRECCFFKRRLVIFFVYFFIVLNIYSFSGMSYIENSKFAKGERIVEIIKLEDKEEINPDLIRLEINKNIQGNILKQDISKLDDNGKSFIQIRLEYNFEDLGFHKIPPLKVIYKNKTYETLEQEIKILREDEMTLDFPVNLYWDFSKKEIYEYESIGLVLRVNWLKNSNIYSNLTPMNGVKDAIIEKIPIFENIKYQTSNNKEILDVPIYNFMLTPLKGTKEVNIAELDVVLDKDLRRISPRIDLKVKSLPEDVKSLAVGDFKIIYELPSSELINQDTFTIVVKISGVGNLPYLFFPEIETHNSKVIYKKKNYNFEPTKDGYKGSISQIYTIKPENKGTIFINIKDFNYFNPFDSKVYYIKGADLKYEYLGFVENGNKEITNLNYSDIDLLSYSDILGFKNKTFLFLVSYSYLILIPGFLLSLAFLLRYKKFFIASGVGALILSVTIGVSLNAVNEDALSELNINNVIFNYNNKNYEVSLSNLNNILKNNPYYSGLWLNRAIILSKMDKDFETIYSAYKSLNTAPNNADAYRVIDYIESKNGINENIRNNSFIFSNIFFIISLILINLIAITISYKFFAKTLKKIVVITLLSLVTFTCFQTYYFYQKQQLEIGIIRGDLVSLYKVPDDFSRSWRFLKGNVSVYILDRKDDFVLIETNYGLKGWVSRNFILSIKDTII